MKMVEPVPFEIFWEQYDQKGYFPDGGYNSPNGYPTDRKKESRYKKYLQWVERQNRKFIEYRSMRRSKTPLCLQPERDAQWMGVQERVWKRDNAKCRLISLLSADDYRTLVQNSGGLHKVLDCAHIKSRGSHPELKYEVDNVVLLNRFSHSMLDSGRHPLTGKACTPEERDYWWMRIITKG